MIMLHIGLTGGIASGKSTVVTMLREFGAGIVDCDVIAHDVVLPGTKGLEAVAAAFGPKALCEDGSMDRAYIGSLVFQDKAKKAQLEGLLFPLIHDGIEEEIRKIEEDKKNPVIFLDMPLLYEIKYNSYVDETWLVYVDAKTQLQRLMQRNGYSEPEALARIHAQLPIDEKRSLAQIVIDNNGSPEATAGTSESRMAGLDGPHWNVGKSREKKGKYKRENHHSSTGTLLFGIVFLFMER